MLEFQKVTATYKQDIGIFDISFKLDEGEMIFLMGPTGAGKSTVLKAVYAAIGIDEKEANTRARRWIDRVGFSGYE